MQTFLDKASVEYYRGSPLITDEEFDYLAELHQYNTLGARDGEEKHFKQLYSLNKVMKGDKPPTSVSSWGTTVLTPKLDGCAISLLYVGGELVQATTRGDGIQGQAILNLVKGSTLVPDTISCTQTRFIRGELVSPKIIDNARNFSAGSAGLKDSAEFMNRVLSGKLFFVAYGVDGGDLLDSYALNLANIVELGFDVVVSDDHDEFPQDGTVMRVDSEREYLALGFTAKHPRGAYAIKDATDMQVSKTTLLSVTWQVGQSGQVTPVAHFEPTVIEDATVSKASLANAGILEALDLSIGDEILVRRAGHIIPQVIGKA